MPAEGMAREHRLDAERHEATARPEVVDLNLNSTR